MSEEGFIAYVLDQLDGLGHVEAKKMFGGRGLYHDGVMFAIEYDGRLYFKVDEDTRPRYERGGSGPFRPNERQTMKSYFEVPADVLEDPDELVSWAADAVEVAR